jgi:hypothetical protein
LLLRYVFQSDDDDSEDTDSSAPITELRKKKSRDKKRSTLKDNARKVQLKKKKLNSGESKTVVVVQRPKSPSAAVASVELSKTPPTAIVPTAAPVPAPDNPADPLSGDSQVIVSQEIRLPARMTTQEMFADTSDDDTVNKNSAIAENAEEEYEQDDEDIYADGEFTELSQKVSDNFPGFLEDLKCPKAGAELTTCLENANDPFSLISSKTKMKLLPSDEYIDYFDFYMTQLIGFGPNTKNFLTSIFIHVLSVNVNDMPVVDYIHSGRLDTAEKRSLAIRKCFIFEYNKDDAPALEVRNKFLSGELPITWDKPKVIQALWQLKSKWASLVVGFAFPKTNVRRRKKG